MLHDIIFTIYYVFCIDEQALVMAAKELGYIFNTRTPEAITVQVVCDVASWKISVYICHCFLNTNLLSFL